MIFPEQFILLDLEYGDQYIAGNLGHFPSLLEVGAIKVSRDLQVLATYSEWVYPQHDDFSPKIASLLDRDAQIHRDRARPVKAVLNEFKDFAGRLPIFAWTSVDSLLLNYVYLSVTGNIPLSIWRYDLASIFYVLDGKLCSLSDACKSFGVVRRGHDALNDCKCCLRLMELLLQARESDSPDSIFPAPPEGESTSDGWPTLLEF